MVEEIPIFRSADDKAQYYVAYDAVLKQWSVSYEEIYIPTRFGKTHVIASGPKEAYPVLLLPAGGGYAPIWVRNVGPISQYYRTYAVDIIGELNRSVPIRPIRNNQEFMDWMTDLLNGLQIGSVNRIVT